jgi:ABC-2 type transport system permease protein
MLWQTAWIETRWRFAIGLLIIGCSAMAMVMLYPTVSGLIGGAAAQGPVVSDSPIGRSVTAQIQHQLEMARTFRGYAWSEWFSRNFVQQWTLFAAIIGAGGLVAQSSGGGALFTLSLPVSRARILLTRAGIGFAQLAAMSLLPSIAVALAAPAVGQTFSLADALIYALSMVIGGAWVFALATWLSTVFADLWRPALLAILAAALFSVHGQLSATLALPDLTRAMTAASWFEHGQLPWLGWLASAAAALLLMYAAAATLARRDF